MDHGIHFISGLPRSGSTLLSALLLQNPAMHAGITSPVGALVSSMLREVSQGKESAVLIDDAQRQALLRGLFDSYYHAIHPYRTVFDTSRGLDAAHDHAFLAVPRCQDNLLRARHALDSRQHRAGDPQ